MTHHSKLLCAVILAAGAGTRLGEPGRHHSKPMLPIAGRPLIDWVIASLRAAGVGRLAVVGHVSNTELVTFLGTRHPDIRYVSQSERRGIADALRLALPLVADQPAYLACACDSLFEPADIRQLIALSADYRDAAAVGVIEMGAEATASRSAVRLDGTRVVEIVEKPASGSGASGLVAVPLYWLPRSMDTDIETTPAQGAERYISTALNAFIARGGTVLALRVGGRLEITTTADAARAATYLRDHGSAYGSG